ncbi:MAG: HAMP domain-containing protein [Clostridia bacterium]|nr:HAMP domain-containing protein [Clostridia bacterium]
MLKFRRYTRTLTAVLLVYVLGLLIALYVVSGILAGDTTRRLAESEVLSAIASAEKLLAEGKDAEELNAALNPALNPAEVTVALLDESGALAAGTAGAAKVLAQVDLSALTEETRELSSQRGMLAMGKQTPSGAIVAAKALAATNQAAFGFNALLRVYLLIALGLTVLAVLLLGWRIMQPVDTLVGAAQRISAGERVEVSEKLPVELRPLGRAFNQMSRRLEETIRALTGERDTLSQVLEGLDEGVLAVDAAGDVLHQNRAAGRLLGSGSAEYARVLTALRTGEEERITLQRGERTLAARLRPLAGGGALALVRDVTENERLERTRRDYVANITHELRTPLSSMRGLTEALCDGLVTDEAERARYYALLLDEVQRLSRLVNDLLELSSLQSNPAAFAAERVDLTETLYELYERGNALARKKGVALSLELPEEGLPEVSSNEDRLQQVMTILLDNAIKFTPAGGTVTLGAQRQARGARLFVRDTGVGMDEYTVQHAFDRFHQADPSHGEKGSGLGLAIAYEIMRRMGGHIAVRSKPGEGSEFSFLVKEA